MKIMILGAGRVGKRLAENLAEKHDVTIASRHPQAGSNFAATKLDLHADVATLTQQLLGFDAVYFVAGSRGKDLLQTDLNGAVKAMKAAKSANIARFVMLSTLYALQPNKWPQTMTDYYIAKYYADMWLINQSGLDYTILQPGALVEVPGSGQVSFDVADVKPQNSIANVASVLAGVLTAQNTIGKVILMSDGTTPIEEAITTI